MSLCCTRKPKKQKSSKTKRDPPRSCFDPESSEGESTSCTSDCADTEFWPSSAEDGKKGSGGEVTVWQDTPEVSKPWSSFWTDGLLEVRLQKDRILQRFANSGALSRGLE